ncbi:MAG: hypothetical protein JNG86_18960 [Verrucomicrobiaceae bacterium]|nr:hypothetical protein [Verrucomicrobiaceae bacterium]
MSAELPTSLVEPAKSPPWWLWPHVLSLEAPLVAVLWQATLARAHDLTLPPVLHAGLALCVWTIYVLDRVWDTFHADAVALDARHAFYRRHRVLFLAVVLPAACLALGWLALCEIPEGVLWQAVSIGVFVGLYFFVYVARLAPALMPKPHAASLVFALGCTAAIRFYSMPDTWADPILECAVLALLVLANLASIAAREEESNGKPGRWCAALPMMLTGNLLVASLLLFYIQKGTFDAAMLAPATAVLAGLALLAVLRRFRTRLSVDAHHVLADLAVIAPLPLVWLSGR